jgi:hypothetical protein
MARLSKARTLAYPAWIGHYACTLTCRWEFVGRFLGGARRNPLAAIYIAVCLVLSVLAFVPQDPSLVFYDALLVVMLPISLPALAVTYIGGLVLFGPVDTPTWGRIAVALLWTGLAALQAFAFLALCRSRGRRARA